MKLFRQSCDGGGGTSSSSCGDNQQRRATRAMTEPSLREEGDDGPPPAARVHNNQIYKPTSTSTARTVVETTARVTTKAARATLAGNCSAILVPGSNPQNLDTI